MIVSELIARLLTFRQDSVVYLSDWQEGYARPDDEVANRLHAGLHEDGSPFLVIGNDVPEEMRPKKN